MWLGLLWLCSARRQLDDDDDDVMLANSSPLKRTRSLGRLSRRWLARHGLGPKGTKSKDIAPRYAESSGLLCPMYFTGLLWNALQSTALSLCCLCLTAVHY